MSRRPAALLARQITYWPTPEGLAALEGAAGQHCGLRYEHGRHDECPGGPA